MTSRTSATGAVTRRFLMILSAALAAVLGTAVPASAGALMQLVAVGAQNLYLTDFTVEFDDGLAGAGDGKMDVAEIVPGSFTGITDLSAETWYGTIVNVPETSATTCDTCADTGNWEFGGGFSGDEGVLVVPATSFTYATRPLAVPEPAGLLLLALGVIALRRARC